MIFKKAIEMQLIKLDPSDHAVVPQRQKTVEELEKEEKAVKYLEKDELNTFLKVCKELGLLFDYTIFMILAYTGMRTGELCALKRSDINVEEKTISVTITIYNPTNNTCKYTLLTPKTSSSVRVIEIDDILIGVLETHKKELSEIKMQYRKTYHDKDFVIVKSSERLAGYPETVKQIEIRMNRLLKLSKLNTSLSLHSLRYTHVSLLAEAGVSLETIMERLGHQDDATTKNIYLHVTKPKKKEAAQKFSELMRNLSL